MQLNGTVAIDLISAARTGDREAFSELTEPHRRELLVHCYRMLGSRQDAEDALQETLVAAWQGIGGFEARSSLRTWLYRIATNRCLNARRTESRRPTRAWDWPDVVPPPATGRGEVPWLEPLPDAVIGSSAAVPVGPEARYERTESISLAFITALQLLPPRQLAVLVLRDVLGFPADEVAEMLGATVGSANSLLKRARANLERRRPSRAAPETVPVPGSPGEQATLARFVRAYEAADIDALVALFTEDVFISMPPYPFEYTGRAIGGRLFAQVLGPDRRFDLVATRANGQPAFATYRRDPSGDRRGTGLVVLALAGDRIGAVTRFEADVLPSFGLPATLADH